MSKVILYIATSSDGFIADKDGGVDWLPHPADDTDELGYEALMERTSVIAMGSRSYLQIIGFGDWAWPDKTTYVFTGQPLRSDRGDVHFVGDGVASFMDNLKEQNTNVWLLGGAELIKSFASEKKIDECIITVVPTILNEGIKLEFPDKDFSLVQTKICNGGIVQKFYVRK